MWKLKPKKSRNACTQVHFDHLHIPALMPSHVNTWGLSLEKFPSGKNFGPPFNAGLEIVNLLSS